MSQVAATQSTRSMLDWLAPCALLVGTLVVGPYLGGAIRPLFVLGCLAIGWFAWQRGPAAHFYSALLLFAFTPFVRRYVDVPLGFDEVSLMLTGPLLTILVPGLDLLRAIAAGARLREGFGPLLVVLFCVFYAIILTLAQGNWTDAASGGLKAIAPLAYAGAIAMFARRDELLNAAVSGFLVVLPIMGLYAAYQYVDPPEWDRYWMENASILSAGYPMPYLIRPFSTMAGPAAYATFTMTGLLLVLFLKRGLLPIILVSPAFMGLLLSQYRTAWIGLAVGIAFCLLFRATRMRAGLVIACAIGLGLAAMAIPPFSDVISDRLATLGRGGEDGSAQERMQQFMLVWNLPDSSVVGSGFATLDVGVAGTMAIDGLIIANWVVMGIPVGMICLLAYMWAPLSAVGAAVQERSIRAVVVAAFAMSELVQIPLAPIGNAELGFLFWTLVVLRTQTHSTETVKARDRASASIEWRARPGSTP